MKTCKNHTGMEAAYHVRYHIPRSGIWSVEEDVCVDCLRDYWDREDRGFYMVLEVILIPREMK